MTFDTFIRQKSPLTLEIIINLAEIVAFKVKKLMFWMFLKIDFGFFQGRKAYLCIQLVKQKVHWTRDELLVYIIFIH